jgi:pimeloyl-ACP methyl ester carboxylesterase
MRKLYCTWAVAALLASSAAAQAPPPAPSSDYTVFVRGSAVGREEIAVRTSIDGMTITSQGRTSAPGTPVIERVEIRYGAAGSPESFELAGSFNGGQVRLRTVFEDGTAVTTGSQQGKPISATQKVSPGAIVVANGIYAGFAALPPLLARASAGHEFRVFVLPTVEMGARVAAIADDRMQTGTTIFNVRRYDLVLADPAGDLAVSVTTTLDGALLRVSIPAQSIDVLRSDIAGATARTDVYSNPGDQAVLVPAAGFNLGATLTVPDGAARAPAVVLAAGSGAPDRDTLAGGVPAMAQLAGALADAGFVVIRYDRRGSGQSGGRAESATLADYAEDVRTIVRWLANRKDVDSRRIAVAGHGEGAWMALLAASKEKRVAAVASLAGPATTGAELVLEQQEYQLDRSNTPAPQRESRVALQKQIHSAVLTGKGWDAIPAEVRRQADTPWFQSLLAFDPAKVVDDVDAPILIVHGDLDREIPVAHAERMADLARNGDSESVELVRVRGVNHLLLPAFTGEVSEYGTLTDRRISGDVTATIAAWLTKTLPAAPSR